VHKQKKEESAKRNQTHTQTFLGRIKYTHSRKVYRANLSPMQLSGYTFTGVEIISNSKLLHTSGWPT